MSNSMRYSLIGDDRLSPVLDRAGDTALIMAGRIELAATDADLAMAGLNRDLEYRVRNAREEVLPESEALGRVIGEHIRGGVDETLSALHPRIQIDADSRPADAEVAALYRRLEALRNPTIGGLNVPVDDAIAEIEEIRVALTGLSETHADPDVRVAASDALFTINLVRQEINRLDHSRATIDVDIDAARAMSEADEAQHAIRRIGDDDGPDRAGRRFGVLGSVVGRVTGLLGKLGSLSLPLLKVGAAIGTAGPIAAGVVTTLGDIAPAAGLAATGILAVVSANAALKIGMSGVGPAVQAAFTPGTKAKALQAALKGLAPEARNFVLSLRSMKPEFDHLKLDVQGRLFTGFGTTVRDLGRSVLPVLRSQLTTTAGVLNTVGLGVAAAAKELATEGTLGRALKGANSGLRNLSSIPGHIVTGLVQVAAAAAPSFNKVTDKAGSMVDKVSAKLSGAFKSGAMETAINAAVGLFGQLFHILGNVGKILGNVLGQAATGGNAFSFLGQLTDTLVKVSAMPGVQAAFGDLFTVMGEVGKVAAPLLGKAISLLAPVLVALAPPALRLIDSLGAGLQPIITALGPVLLAAAGAVGQLADAVSPLLPVVGQMIASLGPVLTPILGVVGALFGALAPVLSTLGAQLMPPLAVLTRTLGQTFAQLSPVLTTALQQLGTQGLTPILTGLTTVISQLVTQYAAQFLLMFTKLLPVIPVLIPVVLQLAKSLGQILVAAAPLIPQILLMGVVLLTQLLPAILPLLPVVVQLEMLLTRLAAGAITTVVIPTIGFLIRVVQGLGAAMHPAITAITWVTTHIADAFQWLHTAVVSHSLPDIVHGVVIWFAGLPGKAGAALAGLAGSVGGRARDAGNRLLSEVRTGLGAAVSWIGDLPGRAQSALGSLGGILADAGRSLISGFVSGIQSKFDSVKSTLGNLTGKLTDWKGPAPKDKVLLTPAGRLLIEGLIAGIDASTPSLKAKLGQVTTLIQRAIDTNKSNRHQISGLSRLSDQVAADNRKLTVLAGQRDAIAAKIAAAKNFASTTAATARGTADLTNLGIDPAATGAGGILAGMQSKLAGLRKFSSYVSDLAKRGLSKDILRELLAEGPEQGLAYASALDHTSTNMLASINRTQGAINQAANTVGKVGADALYDSGKNAGRGFLAGLQSQQAAIQNMMIKIAKAMQTALRHALGIRSPSTVLAVDGGHATEGVAVGVISRLPVLHRAMARVSAAVAGTPLAFSAASAVPGPGPAGGAAPVQVNFNISGALDPVAVGREIRRILLELKRVYGINIDLGLGGATT